jgi:hypothetical protein
VFVISVIFVLACFALGYLSGHLKAKGSSIVREYGSSTKSFLVFVFSGMTAIGSLLSGIAAIATFLATTK